MRPPHQIQRALALDRSLQNSQFSSWRLGRQFLGAQQALPLPAPVHVAPSDTVDYLHTRASVLRNHVVHSEGRCFLFTSGGGTVQLHQLCTSGGSSRLVQVAGEQRLA